MPCGTALDRPPPSPDRLLLQTPLSLHPLRKLPLPPPSPCMQSNSRTRVFSMLHPCHSSCLVLPVCQDHGAQLLGPTTEVLQLTPSTALSAAEPFLHPGETPSDQCLKAQPTPPSSLSAGEFLPTLCSGRLRRSGVRHIRLRSKICHFLAV